MPKPVPVLDVTWCPDPLRPISRRETRRIALTGSDTVDSLVKRLGLQPTPLAAQLNGRTVNSRRWHRKRVHEGDVLVLQQVAHGTEVAAVAMESAAFAGKGAAVTAAIGVVVTFAVNLALSLTVSALLASLAKKKEQRPTTDYTPTAYSIEGGGNTARPYEPLPIVLGEHRFFPDYASRPFAEFVLDPSTSTEVINNVPTFDRRSPPAINIEDFDPTAEEPALPAPWVLIDSGIDDEDTISPKKWWRFGDGAARTYDRRNPDTWQVETVTYPHTFIVYVRDESNGGSSKILIGTTSTCESYQGVATGGTAVRNWTYQDGFWIPGNEEQPLDVVVRYGFTLTYNTERLTSIFQLGFGHIDVSDLRLGSTPLSQYNQVQVHWSYTPGGQGDRTRLEGYSSDGWPSSAYPGNVQVLDGSKLERPPAADNDGWIERRASVASRYFQVDIAGRLFLQASGGIAPAYCQMQVQVLSAGGGGWNDVDGGSWTIMSGSTTPVRNTYRFAIGYPVIGVRVRRVTPDSTDPSIISELELVRIKVLRETDALYPAQHRMGVMIKASSQLSGTLERLSVFVRVRHWIWASGAPWTPGVFPATGAGAWTWGYTTNPAWLFLYYARGGFLHSTAAPAHLEGLQGWVDGPQAGTGQRIFGGGLVNARIDYATIVAWGQFCDAAGLQCRMVVTASRSVGEVLDDIASAGRATKTWATGKLGVVWEAAGQPAVAAFGASNIIANTFSVNYNDDDSVDEVALSYSRSDADYEADTVYAKVPGVGLPVTQRSEQAVYSMPRAQAQRLANLLAASRLYHRRTIRFETRLAALVQRGDVVQIGHDLTAWAYSGRLVALAVDGGLVKTLQLSAPVANPTSAGALWLWIARPNGDYLTVECDPPAQPSRQLSVRTAWPVADAPGWLDAKTRNAASTLPASIPEDWTYVAGPTATPGKRARIIAIEPGSKGRARITVRDEYPAYYPLEWGGLDGAPAPDSGEQLVARAYNPALERAAAGGWRLSWELEGAHGADVIVSVDGAPGAQVPIKGYLTVAGTEIYLPAYATGSHLAITVLPVTAGTPVATISAELEATV
ncbi:host specificity factor TipJ family phage tail protein [uncultured Pseudacidovorax sp.]|uniref:host specificity factor TipJ family phage tail protein n=1 Tax=uncultured Pseudacidovorax sp. TaxID=679313 RepID=UPI0025D3F2D1|nr:host specificity factor TipJ family phage tail protein [uncultured Pseudacidovorax sp.]